MTMEEAGLLGKLDERVEKVEHLLTGNGAPETGVIYRLRTLQSTVDTTQKWVTRGVKLISVVGLAVLTDILTNLDAKWHVTKMVASFFTGDL